MTTTAGPGGEFRFLNLDHGHLQAVRRPRRVRHAEPRGHRHRPASTWTSASASRWRRSRRPSPSLPRRRSSTPRRCGTATTLTQEELARHPELARPLGGARAPSPACSWTASTSPAPRAASSRASSARAPSQTDTMWTLDGVVITDTGAAGASPHLLRLRRLRRDQRHHRRRGRQDRDGRPRHQLRDQARHQQLPRQPDGFLRPRQAAVFATCPTSSWATRACRAATRPTTPTRSPTTAPTSGGPIIKDKLWFWGCYGKHDIRIARLNQTKDKTLLKDYNAKVNWQATRSDMISLLLVQLGEKMKYGRAVTRGARHRDGSTSATRASLRGRQLAPRHPEAGVEPRLQPELLLERQGVALQPASACPRAAASTRSERPRPRELDRLRLVGPLTSGAAPDTRQRRRQLLQACGNHEFKFGFGYRRATTNSSSLVPGNGIQARIETARGKIARIQRELVSEFKGDYTSLYLQDTFTTGRLTVTGGAALRPAEAENAASTAPANPLFPEILPDLAYDGARHQDQWNDISPRVGFTYALDETRARRCCAATSRSSPSSSHTPT